MLKEDALPRAPNHRAAERPPRLRRKSAQNILCALLVLTLVSPLPLGAARKRRLPRSLSLPRQIELILRQTHADRGLWGIEVARISDGKILYKRNSELLFHPASNMKLFTTAAALENLGPDFVFRTTVECDAPPDAAGRVAALTLVGRGDPNLSNRVLPYAGKTERSGPADSVFQQLADQVKARGVRVVQGNIVADDTYFVFEPYGENWGEGDLEWGYGAPVTALAFSDNELLFHVYPGAKEGDRGVVMLDPISDYYKVENRLETVAPGGRARIFVERQPGSGELDVWGQVPLGSGVHEDAVSVANPPLLIGELFQRALVGRGIVIQGNVEVRELARIAAATNPAGDSQAPARVVLAEHDSLPLREEIKVVNKVSQNLHSEMLLRTLGREGSAPGSINSGLEALKDFAGKAGIEPEEYDFTDGSGLSRTTLLAPHALVKLLEYMARSPHFQEFFGSLPVAGVNGLLTDRFHHSRAEGRLAAKTGTLTHVNALSGYMDLPSGQRLAFSILGNNLLLDSKEGEDAIDQIALAIFEKVRARARRRG